MVITLGSRLRTAVTLLALLAAGLGAGAAVPATGPRLWPATPRSPTS